MVIVLDKSSHRASGLSYRAEIDGLRAIAVLSVIFYHAQIILFGRDWFSGGYIGVDVFFVISGYLITRIILTELYRESTFSFRNFYERRARRILPMLFFVLFVSIPFAWLKLLPTDLIEFAQSLISSVFFGSNFFFYFSTTEYGADSSLLKPLLHTWSLGVEEQFYLLFPAIVLLAYRSFSRSLLAVVLVLCLLSLVFAEYMQTRDADLNFYLPFSRFWELAAGSVLAIREISGRDTEAMPWISVLPLAGLALIVYSIMSFDSSTPHPSMITAIPVAGVVLIIGFASKDEFVGRLLGSKPLVSLGLISYSAYLWHYPLFAFTRIEKEGLLTIPDKVILVCLTLIISTLSYRYIEGPFRNRKLISRRMFMWMLLMAVSVSSLFTILVINNAGFEERFASNQALANHEIDNAKLRKQGWELLRARKETNPSFLDVPGKVLIVGNSHARDTFNALDQNRDLFDGYDFISYYDDAHHQLNCFDESITEYAAVRDAFYSSALYQASTLILISTQYRTSSYCHKSYAGVKHTSDLQALPSLVKRALADGKSVIVMANTPEFGTIENKLVADYVFDQISCSDDGDCSSEFETARRKANRLLYEQLDRNVLSVTEEVRAIAEKLGVGFYDKVPVICDHDDQTCDAYTADGYKTIYDYGHYTLEGAKYFGAKMAEDPAFRALMPVR